MRWANLLAGALLVLYPLMVYLGIQWVEPGVLGLALVAVYLFRALLKADKFWQRGALVVCSAGVAALLWYANSEVLLRLLPTGINLALAAVFAAGLIWPPTVPTRMAALHRGVSYQELPPAVLRYTLWVTRLWVGFFLLNASVSAFTALVASREVWALYNGLLAYVVVGTLFAAEYGYRRLVFYKKHGL
ncbi:hypothetical protein [Marinimicrobium sp. ABcell2]|uniref:COG4648 family protein n=1 Tax=Marinimicrobium sp. ABcell2 TaxID=3069751 RepID=UPI0027B4FBE1|nr:hypothetical protein [Marinimicrobium sp. ABcell2]MDQ2076975.1 hypothetical protein [Marinimicrobium sp. ABcell2]